MRSSTRGEPEGSEEPDAPGSENQELFGPERRVAEELIRTDRIRELREWSIFLVEKHLGRSTEAEARETADRFEIRIVARIRQMLDLYTRMLEEGRKEESERLLNFLLREGDPFARYRALQIRALHHEGGDPH